MAFPIAIFSCMLLEKHKPFCEILMGKLMQKCPYIAPMYIQKGVCFYQLTQSKTSTDEAYRRNLGYVKKDDGKYESEIQYGERMCGILSVYAAIIQTTALPHSYGISHGWTWMARILNMPPRRITGLLIITFLEV